MFTVGPEQHGGALGAGLRGEGAADLFDQSRIECGSHGGAHREAGRRGAVIVVRSARTVGAIGHS